MEHEYEYDTWLFNWQDKNKSPFEAYLRTGILLFYKFPFTELEDIKNQLESQYKEGEAVHLIKMFGHATRIVVGGEGLNEKVQEYINRMIQQTETLPK